MKKEKCIHLIVFVLAISVVLFALTIIILSWPPTRTTPGSLRLNPNEIGDFLAGYLGPAVAMSGTLLFFLAILLQRQELHEARAVFTSHRDIANAELKKLEEQVENEKLSATRTALMELLRIRIELRLNEVKLNANTEPNWKKFSQELDDRYKSTEIAVLYYLDHVNNQQEANSLRQLLMVGTSLTP